MALFYGTGDNYTVQMAGPFGNVGSSGKITTVTLKAEDWKNGESPFFQTVEVAGISESSMVELQPDKEQTAALCSSGTALYMENDGGVVTAYAIGAKPDADLTLQVVLTEVVSA